jgi:hypothetical protein
MDYRYSVLLVLVLFDGLEFIVPRPDYPKQARLGKRKPLITIMKIRHDAETISLVPTFRSASMTPTHVLVSCSLTTEG